MTDPYGNQIFGTSEPEGGETSDVNRIRSLGLPEEVENMLISKAVAKQDAFTRLDAAAIPEHIPGSNDSKSKKFIHVVLAALTDGLKALGRSDQTPGLDQLMGRQGEISVIKERNAKRAQQAEHEKARLELGMQKEEYDIFMQRFSKSEDMQRMAVEAQAKTGQRPPEVAMQKWPHLQGLLDAGVKARETEQDRFDRSVNETRRQEGVKVTENIRQENVADRRTLESRSFEMLKALDKLENDAAFLTGTDPNAPGPDGEPLADFELNDDIDRLRRRIAKKVDAQKKAELKAKGATRDANLTAQKARFVQRINARKAVGPDGKPISASTNMDLGKLSDLDATSAQYAIDPVTERRAEQERVNAARALAGFVALMESPVNRKRAIAEREADRDPKDAETPMSIVVTYNEFRREAIDSDKYTQDQIDEFDRKMSVIIDEVIQDHEEETGRPSDVEALKALIGR